MKLIATLGIATTLALVFSCGGGDDEGGGSGGTSSGGASNGGSGGSGGSTGGSGGSTGGNGGSTGGAGGAVGGAAGFGTGGASGNGPGDGGGDVCFPCILTNCQGGIDACNADTDCKAIFDCVSAATCKPPDCSLETCLADHPNGGATFDSTVIACAKTECSGECNFN